MALGLNFVTENAAVARRVLQLLKATGQVQPEVTVSRSKRLKKNNSYLLRVAPLINIFIYNTPYNYNSLNQH